MIDKKKIKIIIQKGLENIDLSELFNNEVKYANEILEYLNTCLWIKQ